MQTMTMGGVDGPRPIYDWGLSGPPCGSLAALGGVPKAERDPHGALVCGEFRHLRPLVQGIGPELDGEVRQGRP